MVRTSLLALILVTAACGTTTTASTKVVSPPTQATDPNAPISATQETVYNATTPAADPNTGFDQSYGWPMNGNVICHLSSSAVDVTWTATVAEGAKTAQATFVDHTRGETFKGNASYGYGDPYSDSIGGGVTVSEIDNSGTILSQWVAAIAIETQTLWVGG